MKSAPRMLSAIVIIFALCIFSRAEGGRVPKIAKLVPAETALLIKIDNFEQLNTQFKKTNLFGLYKDPAMAKFVNSFKTKQRANTRSKDSPFIKTIADANVLPVGRAAFVFVLNEQAKKTGDMPVLFIGQWGKEIDKIKKAVDETIKKTLEGDSRRTTQDYRGQKIITIIKQRPPEQVPDWPGHSSSGQNIPILPPQDFPGRIDNSKTGLDDFPAERRFGAEVKAEIVEQPPLKISCCFVDDCLIVSSDIDVLKFVVAHIKGASGKTLAEDADYTSTMKATGPGHDIDLYVNIKHILNANISEDASGQVGRQIANLGLDNVTAFGLSVGVSRKTGTSFCSKALLKVNGTKKGIVKMLEPESAVIKTPRFIEPSACSVSFLHLSIKKAYDELYKILYAMAPGAAIMANTPLVPPSPDGQEGLVLKRDIIDHLGRQIVFSETMNKSSGTGAAQVNTVGAVEVSNRKALEESLSLFHSKVIAAGNPDARREFLGHTIYLVKVALPRPGVTWRTPMGGLADTSSPTEARLAFTVTDTHLILGRPSSVEQAIRKISDRKAGTISSKKWFITAKSIIPTMVGLAGVSDNTTYSEQVWRLLKEAGKKRRQSASITVSPLPMMPKRLAKLVDFALLPDFDAVRKYFGLSAFYGVSREDGLFFEFNSLNPVHINTN